MKAEAAWIGRQWVGRKWVGRWFSVVLGLVLSSACAPSPKTVGNVTTGITGCPSESLVVFNYLKETRTWSASCGDKLYVCSDGRGGARCSEQQADTIDRELALRAKTLLQLSTLKRAWFTDQDIGASDWSTFAHLVSTVRAMRDDQLEKNDPRQVFGDGSAALDEAVRSCNNGQSVVINVAHGGQVTTPQTTESASPCSAIVSRPELAPLAHHPDQRFLIVPGVFGIKPVERPSASIASATPDAAPASGPGTTSSSVSSASGELDAAVRQWLDRESANILDCTGKSRSALIVNVSAEGKAEVSLRGVAAGAPEMGCVQHALAAMPALPHGPAQILHVVKASP